LACALLCAAGNAARAGAPAKRAKVPAGGIATTIVVHNQAFACRILKHDEENITVLIVELGAVTTLQWSKLAPLERARLKNIIGARAGEALAPVGRKIDGVEVVLKNGMRWRGIELTARRTPTQRCFRFRGVPFMVIATKDIREVKAVKIHEGEVFTARERYERERAIRTPKTAEDHFRMGRWCIENRLPEEATEHLIRCQLLDAEYGPRCKEVKAQLDRLAAGVQAGKLYAEFLRAKAHGRLGRAIAIIDVLATRCPDFERNSDLAKLKPTLVKNRDRQLRRDVIRSYYAYMAHYVSDFVSRKRSVNPPRPVTVIYLKSSFTLRGNLKSSPDADEVVIERGGMVFKIARKLIARIVTVKEPTGPYRWPTLAECRKYVSDRKGGITTDIQAAVAKELSVDEKKVAEIWGKRLAAAHVVDEKGIRRPEIFAAYQEASWSVGSWLRGGGSAPAPRPGPRPGPGPRRPAWPDPETWWKAQTLRVKIQVLTAMCAEAIMKVEKVYKSPCFHCGGSGYREVLKVIGGGGAATRRTCPACRGTGTLVGVLYR
jgi:hypothetical protein